ncbi:hypothetical protein JP75_14365 [Devosia riboflavina]|uniref:Gene transfer agent family protein n=1 Tax=Devosia riboflavina TaxID=46914 RepID=A0A087M1A0_9HYPH|nr:gene transfer agent family protein [Devosia riboflavina]KFL30653.1 hypothetical protein JP75_14365 [Devosia riboflavina]
MHNAFFGDRERDFSLTPHLIPELEKLTGKEIAAIIEGTRRMGYAEMVHAVRLGLIGAGAHPQEAAELVQTYVEAHPLGELHLLALNILTDLWTGTSEGVTDEVAA